jgi:hypothetical protein
MKISAENIGFCGTILFAVTYFLLSFGWIVAEGAIYQSANVVAAAAIGFSSWKKSAMPAVYLEIFWIAVGIFVLGRISMK